MKRSGLFVFSAITLVVIVATIFLADLNAPKHSIEKIALFPELVDKLNDVSSIQVDSGIGSSVQLEQLNNQWVVQSSSNYPASFNKIKEIVITLSDLKILATKTGNPELYSELGVAHPSDDGVAGSKLVKLSDDDGVLIELIIGNRRKNSGRRAQTYVRKPDDKYALLVDSGIEVGVRDSDWYENKILDISADRIQTVTLQKTDQQLVVGRSEQGDTEFKVLEGATDEATVLLDKLGTFLEGIHIDGVQSVDEFEFPEDAVVATFNTFNGLVVTVKSALKDTDPWINFSFSAVEVESAAEVESVDAEDTGSFELADTSEVNDTNEGTDEQAVESATEESARLNAALGAWVYRIPAFKFEALDIDITKSGK